MRFRDFIFSRLVLQHLLIAIGATIIVLWISLKLLDVYTHHGQTITVPDLEGLSEQDIKPLLRNLQLSYTINDSIFDDNRSKGTIAAQSPAAGTHVKKNRTIYLTTVAFLPEMIPMPDLTDLSLRQAVTVLNIYGLRTGNIENRPDIAKNAVLQQKFNNGLIEPGSLVEKGTAIDLVVGQGLGQNRVVVPVLLGQGRDEAISNLNAANLNIGNEFFLDDQQMHGNFRVYRQTPDAMTRQHRLQAGSTVDIYYRSDEVFDFATYLLELNTKPLPLLYGKTPSEVMETLAQFNFELGQEHFVGNVSREKARVYLQSPEYDEEARIQQGTKIDVWYRSVEEFDLEH
jgi:eukaryotic-like serine/threonine-protein kinase